MLHLHNAQQIKRESPLTYEALHAIVAHVNAIAQALGVDGNMVHPQPPDIATLAIAVTQAGQIEFSIDDPGAAAIQSPRLIYYFIEMDTDQSFTHAKVVSEGVARNGYINLPQASAYFRAFSQFLGSPPSHAVACIDGNTGKPALITVGGTGTSTLPPQGSGTGSTTPGTGFNWDAFIKRSQFVPGRNR